MTEANHWEYCGLKLNHHSTDKQANVMLDNIWKATDKRFEFTQDNILQAATVLDIKNFPTKKDAPANFGTLTNHFEMVMLSKGCDTNKILGEWICLKLDINDHHKKLTNYEVWQIVLTSKQLFLYYPLVQLMLNVNFPA